MKVVDRLEHATKRLRVGLMQESMEDCDWYEGIEMDALAQLDNILRELKEVLCYED